MAFTIKHLVSLLNVAKSHYATDVHLRSNETPVLRIKGELVPVQTKSFTYNDILDVMAIVTNNENFSNLVNEANEIDGAYTIPDLCRVRFNFFKYSDQVGVIFRIINSKVPSIHELSLPKIIGSIASIPRGLVLITGPTGSGKSTTLAAMINHINENHSKHVLTIEDPIEYIHTQNKCRITQREVGIDTDSYQIALRSALRQDPDVILVGEMRDPDTVRIALSAAETGHTVFSTMHTTNVLSTIGRILSMFDGIELTEIKKRLSENLHAIIGQRMLKANTPSGITIAQEIMISGPGVKEAISGKEDLSRIFQIMQTGFQKGGTHGQTFDQHIMKLYQEKIIAKDVALEAVSSQADFIQKLIVE